MKNISIFTIVALVALSSVCFCDTIHVPGDEPTIQAGIDAAVNGDTVLVAPGTYAELVDYLGKAIAVMSSDGYGVTSIEGLGYGFGGVVTFVTGEGTDSVLEGFTITNGHALETGGGGVLCENSSPTIRNNFIFENNAGDINYSGYGPGLYSKGGSPVITGNIISHNYGGSHYGSAGGGGLFLSEGAPQVIGNTISMNSISGYGYGGGISVSGDNALIHGNIICNNWGANGGGINCSSNTTISGNIILDNGSYIGGGIKCSGESILIVNNIISDNSAWSSEYASSGGGIYCGSSSPNIINCVICDNIASAWPYESYGGGIYCTSSSHPVLENCILWGNDATQGKELALFSTTYPSEIDLSYCVVKDGQSGVLLASGCTLNWGAGMLEVDPLFVDSDINDYHLTYDSPCRDAGTNAPVTELYDFEGDPRTVNGTVDIGADEFHPHLYCTGDFTPGGSIEGKFVGDPGTWPVGLFIGSGVMDPPLHHMWGDFHLEAPWILIPLVPINADGVLVIPAAVPATPTTPYEIPLQALVGYELTNLFVLEVE